MSDKVRRPAGEAKWRCYKAKSSAYEASGSSSPLCLAATGRNGRHAGSWTTRWYEPPTKDLQGEQGNFGIIEGAIFALFGLVIALTFSGAVSRFNENRMLIAEEV